MYKCSCLVTVDLLLCLGFSNAKSSRKVLKIEIHWGTCSALLSLAMQGIFRGFKDTKTPLYVIGRFKLYTFFISIHIYTIFFSNLVFDCWFYLVSGYTFNVILDPILIFTLKLGIKGAAISHVLSQ